MSAVDGVAGADWPFVGLRPFESADSPFFFGRKESIDMVGELVRTSGFVAIVGSSGAGKSSLVSAGLLPQLHARTDETWRCEIMRPGKSPVDALVSAVSRLRGENDDLEEAWEERIGFCLRSSQFGVAEAISLFPAERRKDRLLIIVDQFEELFRFAALHDNRNRLVAGIAQNRDEATAFVRLLLAASAVESVDIHIVITMRSDFIGDCARFHDLPEAVTRRQFLTPGLTRDQKAMAISGPIQKAGADIDPQLVQRVLNDTTDEVDQLPVIQHVMMRCWRRAAARASGGAVKVEMSDYLNVGGVDEALSRHADEVFAEFAAGGADASGHVSQQLIAKRVFQALTDVDSNGRATRRPMPFGELVRYVSSSGWDEAETSAAVRAVVTRLAAPDCSFLRAPPGAELNSSSIIDIGHEALIRGWGKLKGDGDTDWIREEQDAGDRYRDLVRRVKQGGTIAAAELPIYEDWWNERKPTDTWAKRFGNARDEHSYLAEAGGVIARSRQIARDIEETKIRAADAERAKLEAIAEAARANASELAAKAAAAEAGRARVAADAEAAQANAAVQAAKAVAAESRVQRQRMTYGAVGAVAVVAALAYANALRWHSEDTQRQQELLTLEAGRSVLIAPQLVGAADAVNLLVSAPISNWTPNYVATVRQALNSLREVRRMSTLNDPGAQEPPEAGAVASVSFNPKQPLLAAVSRASSAVHVLRYENHGQKVSWVDDVPAPFSASGLITVRWSPDGNRLYYGVGKRGVIITPCSSAKLRPYLASLCAGRTDDLRMELSGAPQVGFAAWSPNGKTLVTNGFQGLPQLWDTQTGEPEAALTGASKPDGPLTSIAFGGSGAIVAEGESSGAVAVFDTTTGERIQSFARTPPGAGPSQMFFNPKDDRQLLAVYQGASAVLWKRSDDPVKCITLRASGDATSVLQAAFDPDGAFAVTGANDGTLRLYSLKGGAPQDAIELRGHKRAVFALDIASDGTIASGSADGTLRFWRVENALQSAGQRGEGESETEWLTRIGRDNLPFVNFGDGRIELPEAITCAWAGTCESSNK